MAVKIRLKKTGTRNAPCYRVVATDARAARDGRTIEILGFYDPKRYEEKIDLERFNYWVGEGAEPSRTVLGLAERAKAGKCKTPEMKEAKLAEKAAVQKKKADEAAKAKAEEEAKAAAEAAAAEAAAATEETAEA